LRRYRASTHDCRVCPQNRAAVRRCKRRLTSTVHEESRDIARDLAGTPGFERSRNKRKKVETLFAHLKTTMRFEWTRLCGFSRAKDEFFLAAIAQNPRRMVRLAPTLEGRAASRQAAAHLGAEPLPSGHCRLLCSRSTLSINPVQSEPVTSSLLFRKHSSSRNSAST